MAKAASSYKSLMTASDDADNSLTPGVNPTKIVVAAIDFGTTYSAYAYSLRTDFEQDQKIIANQKWVGEGMVSEKVPTTVLFDNDGQFHSFGYEAESQYSELTDEKEDEGWQYFRRFKMTLNDIIEPRRDMVLVDDQGRTKPAVDVFAGAIKYLKDHLMGALRDRIHVIKDSDVFWILTVPAIWNDGAKQFMAEAAQQAGIPKDQFALALEPECAAIYCKENVVFNKSIEQGKLTMFDPGSQYMIVDLGGGTVDITMHEVDTNGNLKELHAPTGGPWGGTLVDKAFDNLLGELFTEQVIKKFINKNKVDKLYIDRIFELKKREIKFDNKQIVFKLPMSLIEEYESPIGEFANNATLKRDKLRCAEDLIIGLFKESKESILTHLKRVLSTAELSHIGTLLLVGGFAESRVIKRAIGDAFKDKRVIAPDDASLAVVKGAVMFGFSSTKAKLFHERKHWYKSDTMYRMYTCISSRKMPYTYGIAAAVPFNDTFHPISKKTVRYGENKCEDIFKVFVAKGTDVIPGETAVRHTFNSPYRGAVAITVEIYKSTEVSPTFTTDRGCSKVGELRLQLSSKVKSDAEVITVKMLFGDTQLEVEAKQRDKADVAVVAEFDFLI